MKTMAQEALLNSRIVNHPQASENRKRMLRQGFSAGFHKCREALLSNIKQMLGRANITADQVETMLECLDQHGESAQLKSTDPRHSDMVHSLLSDFVNDADEHMPPEYSGRTNNYGDP